MLGHARVGFCWLACRQTLRQCHPSQADSHSLLCTLLALLSMDTTRCPRPPSVPPPASLSLQTCLAMLSKPGGLYLDIKSAYSTPRDIQQFVSTLAGIGVHCKVLQGLQGTARPAHALLGGAPRGAASALLGACAGV
jgi:hypothetical protein